MLEFQRAVAPLADVLDDLMAEQPILVREEIRMYLRDVADHIARLNEQVDGFRELPAASCRRT